MTGVVIMETLRRHLVRPGFIVCLLLLGMVGVFASSFNTPGVMWPWLVTMLAIATGAAIIGPEFSTGTLQLIVSKPIARSWYVLSRAIGVFASVALAAAAGLAGESIPRFLSAQASMPWQRMATVFCGALTVSLLTIALLTLLGSLTRSYFNVALYIGGQILLSAAQTVVGLLRVRSSASDLLERYPAIQTSLIAIEDFLYPDIPAVLHSGWLIRVLATSVAALAVACLAFKRREVPYASE